MIRMIILENMIKGFGNEKLALKAVLECISDMESFHSNRAVWITGNFLKNHHLPITSTAVVGCIAQKCCRWDCSNVVMFLDVENVLEIQI